MNWQASHERNLRNAAFGNLNPPEEKLVCDMCGETFPPHSPDIERYDDLLICRDCLADQPEAEPDLPPDDIETPF